LAAGSPEPEINKENNWKFMPVYEYSCPDCGHTEEIVCSMAEHKSSIRCKQCKKQVPQTITGGVCGFVKGTTLGHFLDTNNDKMSLDEKIHHGTRKYQTTNTLLRSDLTEQDRKTKINKETKAITKAHNS
jgi:putative FmdB family regulatory protein